MKITKNNNIGISLFLFQILFLQIFSNYVILPFNIKKENSSSFLSKTNYYTLLSLGQPQKTLELYLLLNQYNFYLGKGLCRLNFFSEYIPYESKTFKNYSDKDYYVGSIINVTNATDNFILFTNDLELKKNITVKDIQFYYGINKFQSEIIDNEKVCGVIGLGINCMIPKYINNYFIKILKQKDVISSYTFSFMFYNNYTKNIIFNTNNKYDNFLIIGINETEISNLFNTNDLRTINITSDYFWRTSIDEIFLSYSDFANKITNKTLISMNTVVIIDNEFDFIFAQKKDFYYIKDYFFKEYIEKKICMLNEDSTLNDYKYISCDINFKTEMNKFPDINFLIQDFNYTFTLTYKDLFIEFNEKIYFMLVNDYDHSKYWTFGNLFLKKFPFIFDYDKKTITFININIYNDINIKKDEKISGINYWLFFIGGICIIVGICFGIIVSDIKWGKNRKKRTNELVDDYEYNTKEDNNEQKLLK